MHAAPVGKRVDGPVCVKDVENVRVCIGPELVPVVSLMYSKFLAGTYLSKLPGHPDVVTDVAFNPLHPQLVLIFIPSFEGRALHGIRITLI